MSDRKVSVVIPVGPRQVHRRWLDLAIISVARQTYAAEELVLVDDMAGLDNVDSIRRAETYNLMSSFRRSQIYKPPWRLGVAHAFNAGVAVAKNELVFMLGADDTLMPNCLEECVSTYEAAGQPEWAYLFVGVRYSDGRDDQYVPCNAAMVTKALWRATGGFPVEAASGAPDAAFISMLMTRPELGEVRGVGSPEHPLYFYRVHEDTDTAGRGPWQGVILQTRDLLTKLWEAPAWGRY